MRRVPLQLVTLAVTLIAIAAHLGAAPTGAFADSGPGPSGTPAENQAATQAYIQQLLGEVTLPADAQPAAADPSANGVLGKAVPSGTGFVNDLDVSAYYTAAESPATALADVENNPPPGTASNGVGSVSGPSGTIESSVGFRVPTTPSGVYAAGIDVNISPPASGSGSAIKVTAWGAWLAPRPAWATIRASVGPLHVSATDLTGKHGYPIGTLTSSAAILRLRQMLNALGAAQPENIPCPLEFATTEGLALRLQFGSRTKTTVFLSPSTAECGGALQLRIGTQSIALNGSFATVTASLWGDHVLRACAPADLRLTAGRPSDQGPAGTADADDADLTLTPLEPLACGIEGTPALQLLGAAGRHLSTSVEAPGQDQPHSVVVLDPDQPAVIALSWTAASATCTGAQARAIAVTLPHAQAPLTAQVTGLAPCGGRLIADPLESRPLTAATA